MLTNTELQRSGRKCNNTSSDRSTNIYVFMSVLITFSMFHRDVTQIGLECHRSNLQLLSQDFGFDVQVRKSRGTTVNEPVYNERVRC